MNKFLLIPLFCFLLSCDRYESIPPGSTRSCEITFVNEQKKSSNITSLYTVPAKYDFRKSYPLIITLHGYGANKEAFHELWKPVTTQMGFVLLTPQGNISVNDGFGWTWGKESDFAVLKSLEYLRTKVNIDNKKIYLAGFSDGGRLSYYLGIRNAHLFNGIAALCSPFTEDLIPENYILMNELKAYISYGELENYTSNDAKTANEVLQNLGVTTKLVEYKGIGHTLPEPKSEELERIIHFLK